MAKSIMQVQKECFVCNTPFCLEKHHVIFGNANRKLSEEYGLTVWLCHEHHTGNTGVHFNKELDNMLKQYAQRVFQTTYPEKSFRNIFGKNYL